MGKNDILLTLNVGGSIQAEEVYDYGCPIREIANPQGQTGIAKMHFSSRMDSTLYPCAAHISLSGALLYFLDDLNASDAMQYKDFIQDAFRSANAAKAARARRSSNIVMAEDLPPGENFGRRSY